MYRITRILATLTCLALAACNGTALVTLTATPATVTHFLTYRVMLVSVALQQANGGSSQNVLPAPVSVDLTQVTDVSEILSAATVKKGTYTSVAVTLDYSNAVIVADDGQTLGGVALTAQNANAQSIGNVTLTLAFDPANTLGIARKSTSQFALDFRLSASNNVNMAAHTVTVTPVMIASALSIDSKALRLRGPLASTNATNSDYTAGIEPFDGLVSGAGSLQVVPSTSTLYEVNGIPSIGAAGFTALSGLSSGAWTVAYGTLTATTNSFVNTVASASSASSATSGNIFATSSTTPVTTFSTTTTVTDVSFTPTQIFAGSSVQGASDRISGIVAARSANTLTVPTATLISSAGAESFVSGVATITLGASTAVTVPDQSGLGSDTSQQVSVGSRIDAFGTVTANGGGNVALDASAGHVRLGNTVASGLVTSAATGLVNVDLTGLGATLGGRSVLPFVFVNSVPALYQVNTGGLDISNLAAGVPAELTGLVASYGATSPDFTATALADPTTINAELVLDWGSAGRASPFAALSSSEIDLAVAGAGAGIRHQIAVGAQLVDVSKLPTDVLIVPSTSSTQVFAIAHASTSTVESFNTFAAFTTQLQAELDGTRVATTITAEGIYTASGTTLAATSVTITLNI
jgi:Domain of unknown function (DUF4382)